MKFGINYHNYYKASYTFQYSSFYMSRDATHTYMCCIPIHIKRRVMKYVTSFVIIMIVYTEFHKITIKVP